MPDLRSLPRTRYGGIQKVLKGLDSPPWREMTLLIEDDIYGQTLISAIAIKGM